MEKQSFQELADRYLNDRITQEELNRLREAMRSGEMSPDAWDPAMLKAFGETQPTFPAGESHKQQVLNNIKQHIAEDSRPKVIGFRRNWLRTTVAAAAVVAAVITGFYLFSPDKNTFQQADAAPGGNHAKLVLADGKVIVLDQQGVGALAEQPGMKPVKSGDDLLVYAGENNGAIPVENTLQTPEGGQYSVVLPDGTRVWLNASSALKYPSAFTGKERRVELLGEAYFEVKKNTEMPFHVYARGMELEVLGTHFNVMAYANEQDIRTTLTEGAVKLKHGNASVQLEPGFVASISPGDLDFEKHTANEAHELAWKNGLFSFHKADIPTIMRQIERWYKVKVVYTGDVPEKHLVGEISRNSPLSKVLRVLELSGVECKLEGNTLTVSP